MRNTIVAIRVMAWGNSIHYRVEFKESFVGIAKDSLGNYSETEVNYVDFTPQHLIAVVLSLVEGANLLYLKKKEQGLRSEGVSAFGAAELSVLLRGATVELNRQRFEAGDEYVDKDGNVLVHEHAGYNTGIDDIRVSSRIQEKLDALADSILGL